LFNAPDVCVGSFPDDAVVPAPVTSYKLFLYFKYCPTVTGVFEVHSANAGIPSLPEDIFFTVLKSKNSGVTLIVFTASLLNHRVL